MAASSPHTSPGIVPVARYSSADQRPQDRYPAWQDGSLLSFGRMYETVPLASFGVETASAQLGAVSFSSARMSALSWERTRDHVRADGADPLMVAIRFQGALRGVANDRGFEAPEGAAALSDFAQPQTYVSDRCFNAVLTIPRDVAERRLPRVRDLHGLVVPPPAALLLRAHALAMIDALAAGVPAEQAERLGGVTLDLLEIGVAQSVARPSVSPAAGRTGARLAAEIAIDRALGSPNLTVANLCRWIGVSRTNLYRLFEDDGGVQAHIRARRLHRIEEDLRKGSRESLVDLAERWGFSDAAHLSRLFRARYGMPPGEYREHYGDRR